MAGGARADGEAHLRHLTSGRQDPVTAISEQGWWWLIVGDYPALLGIIGLSLSVSFAATGVAAGIGVPLGTLLAIYHFPGRHAVVLLANALLGLPPVVVGMVLYVLLSRSGPLGRLQVLFTPGAMMLAQTLLALPIITAITHRAMVVVWRRYGDDFLVLGLQRRQVLFDVLVIGRAETLTAVLAGFGRTLSEVGAILIVGGNIAGYTRTMTTAITLETSQGNVATSLALGLVLIVISVAVSATAFMLSPIAERTRR